VTYVTSVCEFTLFRFRRRLKITDKIAALRKTVLFSGLQESELKALSERAVDRRLPRGEILFIAGEEARGLYVIVEGSVRAFRIGPDGREQIIHVEQAPATFAEVPVFDDGKYPSNVAAEEDTVVLFLAKSDVRRLCIEHPTIALASLKVLAGRLRSCAELVETLSLREVGQRLARLLLGELNKAPAAKPGTPVSVSMTHIQMAARVGSVREVVSRALGRLQQDGLIKAENRKITILNAQALSDYADNE
jgi:CRP-like cAMP-binding protein